MDLCCYFDFVDKLVVEYVVGILCVGVCCWFEQIICYDDVVCVMVECWQCYLVDLFVFQLVMVLLLEIFCCVEV